MDHAGITERFLSTHFPAATTAVIAGSTARGERTASSDIDLLLLGEDLFDDGAASMAATYSFEDEVFEVFAYTVAGFDEWAQRGIRQHRPVIAHMLVEGSPLRTGQEYSALRARWAATLAAGPDADPKELEFRRYVITDVLDDLRDAVDPLERQVLAATLFEKTAELMLLCDRRWIGTGKYLPRRLRELDGDRVEALSRPLLHGDLRQFSDAVERELERAGGRVQAGFTR